MKSDFRINKSLAADIQRIESSLTKNKRDLLSLMSDIKNQSTILLKDTELNNSVKLKESLESLDSYSSTMRDVIDSLENDMISIEGIDMFEIKTSPDKVIEQLRKLRENTRKLDTNVENQVKLISKLKGNGEFKEEIDDGERAINLAVQHSDEMTAKVANHLDNILLEVDYIKEHSKNLLKSKIL